MLFESCVCWAADTAKPRDAVVVEHDVRAGARRAAIWNARDRFIFCASSVHRSVDYLDALKVRR